MVNLVLRLFITIAALKGTDFLLADFNLRGDLLSLLYFGIALGLLNWLIKPVLVFFSFPFLVLTIGLFYFVINALVMYAATIFVPGVLDASMGGILLGSTIVSVLHWFLAAIFRVRKKD